MDLPMGVDWARMDHRRSLLSAGGRRSSAVLDTTGISASMDAYYQTAFGLMHSAKAKKAFEISEEPEALREKYGRTSLGQGALLARRLVENGVRFVTVSRGFNTWDHHKDIFPLLANDFLPGAGSRVCVIIEDLHQRGMLDSTMVIVTGEFGRTPEINARGGRDHWPNAFSMVMAGRRHHWRPRVTANRREGRVREGPSRCEMADLFATVYKKLGIDYNKEYISNIGRPIKTLARKADRVSDGVAAATALHPLYLQGGSPITAFA